jgi:hypothetical protein
MALTQTLFAAGVLLTQSQDKDKDDRAPIPHDVVEGQSQPPGFEPVDAPVSERAA